MVENLIKFWEDRKKTRLGQMHLLWITSLALAAITAVRATELPLQERLLVGLVVSLAVFFGLVLMYLLPSMYLAFIRKRREEGRNVFWHRILLGFYCFPIIPWLFFAFVALIMNLGIKLGYFPK